MKLQEGSPVNTLQQGRFRGCGPLRKSLYHTGKVYGIKMVLILKDREENKVNA